MSTIIQLDIFLKDCSVYRQISRIHQNVNDNEILVTFAFSYVFSNILLTLVEYTSHLPKMINFILK